jgi:hypothetical protein
LAVSAVKFLDVVLEKEEVILEAAMLQHNIFRAIVKLRIQLVFNTRLGALIV